MSESGKISNAMPMADSSPIRDFYRGKVIFLTGATGVLGELFVEKLLRLKHKTHYWLNV